MLECRRNWRFDVISLSSHDELFLNCLFFVRQA